MTPTLTNAIERILALAAQAAMQSRTDQDLLNAIDRIRGEVRAAEYEFFGPTDDYQPTPEDLAMLAVGPTPDDVPF